MGLAISGIFFRGKFYWSAPKVAPLAMKVFRVFGLLIIDGFCRLWGACALVPPNAVDASRLCLGARSPHRIGVFAGRLLGWRLFAQRRM
jgi:hypothetical protein